MSMRITMLASVSQGSSYHNGCISITILASVSQYHSHHQYHELVISITLHHRRMYRRVLGLSPQREREREREEREREMPASGSQC